VNGVHRKPVGYFAFSHTASASLPHMFPVYVKSRRETVFRLPHFIPVESQRKLSGHEKEKFEFDRRNFGSKDAA